MRCAVGRAEQAAEYLREQVVQENDETLRRARQNGEQTVSGFVEQHINQHRTDEDNQDVRDEEKILRPERICGQREEKSAVGRHYRIVAMNEVDAESVSRHGGNRFCGAAVGRNGTHCTVKEGSMFVSLGTSGVVFAPCAEFAASTNGGMHVFRHANGRFHFMGCMLTSAGAMKWWAEEIVGSTVGKLLDEVDGCKTDDLLFLPYLMGERSPINDPNAKGAFYGLNLSHKRSDMTKSVLEGICFGLKDCYENIKSMGASAGYARVIGGGSRSDKWMQILSDILGLELRRINTSDGAGLGAVILAMVGCGAYPSLTAACDELIGDTDVFMPVKDRYAAYEKKFREFKKLYARLK